MERQLSDIPRVIGSTKHYYVTGCTFWGRVGEVELSSFGCGSVRLTIAWL